MVVARGIMIMDRINVRPTTAQFQSFSPTSPASCSGSPSPVTIVVRVIATAQVGLPNVHPSGIVDLIDSKLNSILASVSLVNAGPANASDATFNSVNLNDTNNLIYARYNGIVNQFGRSLTSISEYLISLTGSALSFTTPATSSVNICKTTAVPITVLVQSGGSPVTSGTVQFRLYSTENSFTNLTSGTLNGSGNASTTVPANTVTQGEIWGVQAIFPGSACIAQTASPTGITGSSLQINSVRNDVTNVGGAFATNSQATFCRGKSKQFSAVITGTLLPAPSTGTVTMIGHKAPSTTITLGTATANGASPTVVTVPPYTFTSNGTWTVSATYTGGTDGCYADSVQVAGAASFTVTEDSTTTVINSVTPSTFSRTAGGNVAVSVTVTSGVAGSIDGTIEYYVGLGLIFTDTVVAGSVSSNIPKINFPVGTSQTFSAFFRGDTGGSDCYAESIDSQVINVNA